MISEIPSTSDEPGRELTRHAERTERIGDLAPPMVTNTRPYADVGPRSRTSGLAAA